MHARGCPVLPAPHLAHWSPNHADKQPFTSSSHKHNVLGWHAHLKAAAQASQSMGTHLESMW